MGWDGVRWGRDVLWWMVIADPESELLSSESESSAFIIIAADPITRVLCGPCMHARELRRELALACFK